MSLAMLRWSEGNVLLKDSSPPICKQQIALAHPPCKIDGADLLLNGGFLLRLADMGKGIFKAPLSDTLEAHPLTLQRCMRRIPVQARQGSPQAHICLHLRDDVQQAVLVCWKLCCSRESWSKFVAALLANLEPGRLERCELCVDEDLPSRWQELTYIMQQGG